jgi:hypothetical protein
LRRLLLLACISRSAPLAQFVKSGATQRRNECDHLFNNQNTLYDTFAGNMMDRGSPLSMHPELKFAMPIILAGNITRIEILQSVAGT